MPPRNRVWGNKGSRAAVFYNTLDLEITRAGRPSKKSLETLLRAAPGRRAVLGPRNQRPLGAASPRGKAAA